MRSEMQCPVPSKMRGVTSVEYALLAALIALAIVGVLNTTGAENGGLWGAWTARAIAAFGSGGS